MTAAVRTGGGAEGGGLAGSLGGPVGPDLFSGSLSVAINIIVPGAPGASAPALKLLYRTSGRVGWLGVGWDLELDSIGIDPAQRRLAKRKQLAYFSSGYAVNLLEVEGGRHRKERDDDQSLFERRTAANGDYWILTDRQGTKRYFGRSADSRRVNQKDGSVVRWYMDGVEDLSGNYAEITYRKDRMANRPAEIQYSALSNGSGVVTRPAVHKLRFLSEPKNDVRTGFRDGAAFVDEERLRSIQVVTNNRLEYAYHFEYRYSQRTGRSLLQSAYIEGYDGLATPKYRLNYVGEATGTSYSEAVVLPTGVWPDDPARWTGRAVPFMNFADLDGSGSPYFCAPEAGALQCWESRDGKFSGMRRIELPADIAQIGKLDDAPLQFVDVDLDGQTDVCASFTGGILCLTKLGKNQRPEVRRGPQWKYDFQPGVSSIRFADVNGDGYQDICHLGAAGFECFPGTSTGFRLEAEHRISGPAWRASPLIKAETGISDASGDWAELRHLSTISLVDLNGDGLADLCGRSESGMECYLSDGKSFKTRFTAPAWSNAPPNPNPEVPVASSEKPVTNWGLPRHYETISFADLNGDGFPEICGVDLQGLVCYLNVNGERFALDSPIRGPDWGSFLPPESPPDSTNPSPKDPNRRYLDEERFYRSIKLIDLNGDGRSDLCARDRDGVFCYLSNGTAFSSDPVRGPPIAAAKNAQWDEPDFYRSIRIQDVNGDGAPDWCGRLAAGITCWLSPGFSDLLNGVTHAEGATHKIAYSGSATTPESRCPFSMPVVTEVTSSDGRGRAGTTSYRYRKCYYFTPDEEFRGFAEASVMSPPIASGMRMVESTHFHQGSGVMPEPDDPSVSYAATVGKKYRVELADSEGNRHRVSTFTYVLSSENPPHYVPLRRSTHEECAESKCTKTTEEEIEHDFAAGAPARSVLRGNPALPGSQDRVVERSYVSDKNRNIIGLVSEEKVFDGTAELTLRERTRYIYDGSTNCTTTSAASAKQGPLTRGLVTETYKWESGDVWAGSAFSYDKYGNITCIRDPIGASLQTTYDNTGSHVVSTRNSLGHVERQYHAGVNGEVGVRMPFGSVTATEDVNGNRTLFVYDSLMRLQSKQLPNGSKFTYQYNDLGDPAKQNVREDGPYGRTTLVFLDGYSRTYRRTEQYPGMAAIEQLFEFDERGNSIRRSLPFSAGSPEFWERFEYDAFSRLTKRILPSGRAVTYCFGLKQEAVVDDQGARTLRYFDAFGNLIQVLEFQGRSESCSLAASGETVARINFKSDGLGRPVSYEVLGGVSRKVRYNGLGLRTDLIDASGISWTYSHDLAGNLHRQVDPLGNTVTIERDAVGRPKIKTRRKGDGTATERVEYFYDSGPGGIGRLTSVTDKEGKSSFAYDVMGQLARTVRSGASGSLATSTSFDLYGRIATITYPDKDVIRYQYAGAFLSSIEDAGGAIVRYSDFNPIHGATTSLFRYGISGTRSFSAGDSSCFRELLATCRIEYIRQKIPTAPKQLLTQRFSFDALGRIETIDDSMLGVIALRHDDRGRLVSATRTSASERWTYNERDDILSSPLGKYSYQMAQGRGDVLATAGKIEVTSDAVGNARLLQEADSKTGVVLMNDTELAYDAEHRVVSLRQSKGAQVTYAYDGDGGLVERRRLGEVTTYIGRHYECQQGKCMKKIFAGNQLIALKLVGSSRVTYVLADVYGSTRVLASENDEAFLKYTAYGEKIGDFFAPRVDGFRMDALFIGQAYEEVSGFYRIGARVYDPRIGRFLQPDSIIAFPASPRLANRFAYGGDNPYVYVDSNGNFIWAVIIGGAIIGGLSGGFHAMAHGGNFFEGFLRGAVVGAAFGAVGGLAAYAAGAGLAAAGATASTVQWGSVIIGGGITGAIGAAVEGRDPAQGALWGAIGGAVGFGAGKVVFSSTGGSLASQGWASQGGRDALRGAMRGFVVSALQGRDPLQGAMRGSLNEVAIGFATTHMVAPTVARISGAEGYMNRAGGRTYFGAKTDGGAITFGRAMIVPSGKEQINSGYPSPGVAWIGRVFGGNDAQTVNLITHEAGHMDQYDMAGSSFLPAYGVAQAMSAGAAGSNPFELSQDSWNRSHSGNAWETTSPRGVPESLAH